MSTIKSSKLNMDTSIYQQPLQTESSSSVEACSVCEGIKSVVARGLEHNPGDPVISKMEFTRMSEGNLGPLVEIQRKSCPGHDDLLRFVIEYWVDREKSWGPQDELVLFQSVSNECGVNFQLWKVDDERYIYGPSFILTDTSIERQRPGFGRILNKDWVDMTLLRWWIDACLRNHDSICNNPFQLTRISPVLLIDTINSCVVAGDGVQDYIALSYTWGEAKQLQNNLTILGMLQQPEALCQPQFANCLSPTLKHAIGLTRALGERYLWADTLCIVEDNGVETAAQLQSMGLIYASAKFTIVATDGHATHGIPGLKGISPSRELVQHTFPLGEDDRLMINEKPWLGYGSGCSPYFKRAWTFQEYLLSRRRLIIGDGKFHWKCSCMVLHEDMYSTDHESFGYGQFSHFPNILSGIPDFRELGRPLKEYNGRDLTFPEDALAAISGFFTIINCSFEGGFIFGIAEMCFDSALMWTVPSRRLKMQRRIHSGKNHTVLLGSQAPSWSWLGWKGGELLILDENSGELDESRFITRRITDWYSHETPFSDAKRAIQPSFLDRFDYSRDDASKVLLLDGWKRETFDPSQHVTPKRLTRGGFPVLGEYVYKHDKLPGKYFWRQFHVKDTCRDSNLDAPPQHPYLSCKTKRGWFGAKLLPEARFVCHNMGAHVLVLGEDNMGCGFLQLHSEEQTATFPTAESKESYNIELVAICFRTQPMIETDASIVEDLITKYGEFQEMYGVLWVEWIDKVAYRRGAGYIRKERWESHELEEVDLILG
jgi:hypothetical protein